MRSILRFGFIAAALGLILAGNIMAGVLAFTNGDFQTGDLTGWTSTTSVLNPFGTSYNAGNATYWHWLGGGDTPATGITTSQTITGLTPGTTYAVNFIMASEATLSNELNISVDGGPSTVISAPPYNGLGLWDNWVSRQYQFIAGGTTATIQFDTVGLNLSGYDVGLDNVTLSTADSGAPEPSTLILIGIGLSAFGLWRRR